MSKSLSILQDLKNKCNNYWGSRIISQLEYAYKLSKINGRKFDKLIGETIEFLKNEYDKEGTISKSVAEKAEGMIGQLSETAKKFKVICAAHAHIDMNWMWGYHETVAVTLDTFRTMLDLMEEYPEYKFSQSQASVYRIVEEYDPDMLEEIKRRVKEGRWEVTASTWVETDKNMPNGESLARHILYTKKYLSKLLDIDPEKLKIDFEPDTFGHNVNVPETLNRGGVKYYYHCRGYDKHNIYRWKSPSGSSVIVYREPFWYNAHIEPSMVLHVPEFCTEHGIDTALKVYGVGDHGGGPTRKDIEKIIDMAKWPVFPEIRFGTFAEYFSVLEKIADNIPVVENELNFIFTGCYTTQTRIKLANRISEAKLYEAESLSSLSNLFAGGCYKGKVFEKAWENVLFNHFHDIIPGSGVIDTREYAMGLFQKTVAAANTEASAAMRNIASQIDTSGLFTEEEDIRDTMSEGGGAGYGIMYFDFPQTERGRGKNRIFHFFNSSSHDRNEVAEIVVWDWDGDINRIMFKDCGGNTVQHQIIENRTVQFYDSRYWGHKCIRVLLDVSVPAYGYSTYTMSEKDPDDIKDSVPLDPRIEPIDEYILENNCVRAVFNPRNASLISLMDKKTGREMLNSREPAGVFRLIEEDDGKGMTSWVVGRYMRVFNLNSEENVKIIKSNTNKESLRQWIEYEIEFRGSKIKVKVSLDKNSSRLDYEVECDWQERAARGKFIPQLNFYMPLGYECEKYKYDIPFGTIEREGMDRDVPANSWILGVPKEGNRAVMLVTQSKYGFRGIGNSAAITLIRSSYDPDPYPENGIHSIKFAVNVVDCDSNSRLIKQAFDYNHPIRFISGTLHEGSLPLKKGFICMESESVVISAVKKPEQGADEDRLIIRVYETGGNKAKAALRFARNVKKAFYVDINENPVDTGLNITVEGDRVEFEVGAYSVASICVEFE
ncbi:MAG TPA: alpha-mannosidase [Clostridiaceae bacterium]|nr:alpha-mannosidase [Clostridiaceae bacterium]